MEQHKYDNPSILTWDHPRFEEFIGHFHLSMCRNREGFRPPIDFFSISRTILQQMGGIDVEKTIAWMREHGTDNDIDVFNNIIVGYLKRLDRGEIPSVLTWHHPRFPEFTVHFGHFISPERRGLDLPTVPLSVTRMILQHMGGLDVEKTIDWMAEQGACCNDVEVGLNIIGGYWERVDSGEIAPWDGHYTT